MTFKIGDEVWFLIEIVGWDDFPICIKNLNIRKRKITEGIEPYFKCEDICTEIHQDTLYKSKNEIIDAIINRLEELKYEMV